MTKKQREILTLMEPGQPVHAGDIARGGRLAFPAAIQLLARLHAQGCIEPAEPDEEDVTWRLTPKGESFRRRTAPPEPRKPKPKKRAKTFTERYADPEGKRYGALFQIVRVLRCWLCVAGYEGPGHRVGDCARGVQGGHTAHHVGELDEDGLIPGGGAAHDLYAGLGGRRQVAHYRDWLEEHEGLAWPHAHRAVGKRYVEKAREIRARGDYGSEEMAW